MDTKLIPLRKSLDNRFWSKVDKTETCWLWTGAVTSNGYGALQKGRRGEGIIRPHRFSCEMRHGPIPKGMVTLHSCDNKLCVNPDHLSIGTYSKNISEAYDRGLRSVSEKGRQRMRDMNKKLSEAQILEIRELRKSGISGVNLAKMFGVSNPTISSIITRRTWKHV